MGWKPIRTAPREGASDAGNGPLVWLRNGERRLKGFWKPASSALRTGDVSQRAGWRDQQGDPLRFEPVEWMELDA